MRRSGLSSIRETLLTAEEVGAWLAAVNADRDLLERAAKLSPESEVGKSCAEVLANAGR